MPDHEERIWSSVPGARVFSGADYRARLAVAACALTSVRAISHRPRAIGGCSGSIGVPIAESYRQPRCPSCLSGRNRAGRKRRATLLTTGPSAILTGSRQTAWPAATGSTTSVWSRIRTSPVQRPARAARSLSISGASHGIRPPDVSRSGAAISSGSSPAGLPDLVCSSARVAGCNRKAPCRSRQGAKKVATLDQASAARSASSSISGMFFLAGTGGASKSSPCAARILSSIE